MASKTVDVVYLYSVPAGRTVLAPVKREEDEQPLDTVAEEAATSPGTPSRRRTPPLNRKQRRRSPTKTLVPARSAALNITTMKLGEYSPGPVSRRHGRRGVVAGGGPTQDNLAPPRGTGCDWTHLAPAAGLRPPAKEKKTLLLYITLCQNKILTVTLNLFRQDITQNVQSHTALQTLRFQSYV